MGRGVSRADILRGGHSAAGAGVFPFAVLVAAMAAGFATKATKTARVAHGVLAKPIFAVALKGFVETREERQRTDRSALRVEQSDQA